MSLVLVAAALLFIANSYRIAADFQNGRRFLLGGCAAIGLNWWALHRHGRLHWTAGFISLVLVAVIGGTAATGAGIEDTALNWLAIAPLVAVFLVGPGFGTVVALLGAALLWWLYSHHGEFRPRSPNAPSLEWLSGTTFLIAVFLCARMYELARGASARALEETLHELQQANERMQLLTQQTAVQKEKAEAEAALKGEFLRRMLNNAGTQGQALEETRHAMKAVTEAVRVVAQNVTVLTTTAREAGRSADQMAQLSSNNDLTVNLMSESVQEVSASIQEMRMTLREVSKNVESLLQITEATNASMTELNTSIRGVETTATETATLAEHVIRDAERGRQAVTASLRGTETIRQSAHAASTSLSALASRIGDIGAILTVIRDVADRTNLLALNASIIAAQAGDSGKGFAVVAEQIKELAEETGGSVKQIETIVTAIERQSQSAVRDLKNSTERVEAGVELSRDAERALAEITRSAELSNSMVRSIAQATVEQAKSINYVAREIERVAQTTGFVATAVREQHRASDQIAVATDKLGDMMPLLENSASEQATAGETLKGSMQRIGSMVEELGAAQVEQSRETERILQSLDDIADAQAEQVKSVERMGANKR